MWPFMAWTPVQAQCVLSICGVRLLSLDETSMLELCNQFTIHLLIFYLLQCFYDNKSLIPILQIMKCSEAKKITQLTRVKARSESRPLRQTSSPVLERTPHI